MAIAYHTHNIELPVATTGEAQVGLDVPKVMFPNTTKDAITAQVPAIIANSVTASLASTALQTSDVGALAFKSKISNSDWSGSALSTTNGGVPTGGVTSQLLAKGSNANGDLIWISPSAGDKSVPVGGALGQVLTKSSGIDNDAVWADGNVIMADSFAPAGYVWGVDDTQVINNAISFLTTKGGGTLVLPRRTLKMAGVVVNGQNIRITGQGKSYSTTVGTMITPSDPNDCIFNFVGNNGVLDNVGFDGLDLQQSNSLIRMTSSNFTFENVQLRRGFNGISCENGGNRIRFYNVNWADFYGEFGIKIGNGSNIHDFFGCSFGAKRSCDNIVFEGRCGSTTFYGCAVNFGRHGVVCRALEGQPTEKPGNIYWLGKGFENVQGCAFYVPDAGTLRITGAYMSGDGANDTGVYLGPNCTGPISFSNNDIRGFGGDGIYDESPSTLVVSGSNKIVNNGSKGLTGRVAQITNVTNNGSGLILLTAPAHGFTGTISSVDVAGVNGVPNANGPWRTVTVVNANTLLLADSIFAGSYTSGGYVLQYSNRPISSVTAGDAGIVRVTTPIPHGYNDYDTVIISGVVGSTEANGQFIARVITENQFDLVGTTFVNAYESGGVVYRKCANIHLSAIATGKKIISANALGGDVGTTRALFGIRNDMNPATGILIAGNNDITGLSGTGGEGIFSRLPGFQNSISGNRVETIRPADGFITISYNGTVANGIRYSHVIGGRSIILTSHSMVLGAGTATVSIRKDDGTSITGNLAVSTTPIMGNISNNVVIGTRTTADKFGVNISAVSGATDLLVTVGYVFATT